MLNALSTLSGFAKAMIFLGEWADEDEKIMQSQDPSGVYQMTSTYRTALFAYSSFQILVNCFGSPEKQIQMKKGELLLKCFWVLSSFQKVYTNLILMKTPLKKF